MELSCRYILAWMGCLGVMNVYFCRINLSVAMVAMVGVDRPRSSATGNSSCAGLVSQEQYEERLVVEGEFQWSKRQQGLVTASYFWSYAACQVPAAWLASRHGHRRVFGLSMLGAAALTALFPLAARSPISLSHLAQADLPQDLCILCSHGPSPPGCLPRVRLPRHDWVLGSLGPA